MNIAPEESIAAEAAPNATVAAPDTANIPPFQPAARSKLASNSIANIVRIGLASVIAILLPAYLIHHLSIATYATWVLILQMGAYVGYLDFGVQTALAKYIAEHEAKGDLAGAGRSATAGFAITLCATVAGLVLTAILAWRLPSLFQTMPADLVRQARLCVLLVGSSLAINLSASVFSAIFLGLQRYRVPMVTTTVARLLSGGAVVLAVAEHRSLLGMGILAATANLISAALQVGVWKMLASHIRVTLRNLDKQVLRRMLAYCGVMTIWSVCQLFISGLDVSIVGHFAFREVGFYSIATSPTTMLLMLISAVFGPLLPAASAWSVERTPKRMGETLLQITRFTTLGLLITGLPLMVLGYYLLRVWVGPVYALHSLLFLQILLLANVLRNLCVPYSTMIVALARQTVGTVSNVLEAAVNIACSLILARHLGAMGVAIGTLVGALTGLIVHFSLTMHYTKKDLTVGRKALLLNGILLPASMALPSILLARMWWRQGPPTLSPLAWTAWAVTSLMLLWFVGLNRAERQFVVAYTSRLATAGTARGRQQKI